MRKRHIVAASGVIRSVGWPVALDLAQKPSADNLRARPRVPTDYRALKGAAEPRAGIGDLRTASP
jgi:hypothetical protein